MTVLVQASSKEVRDMIIESGMEAGMQDAYDLWRSWPSRLLKP
jgi:hypothetical protein